LARIRGGEQKRISTAARITPSVEARRMVAAELIAVFSPV
jgi:hypothetical protein